MLILFSASAIDYAISLWADELVFAPGRFYVEATSGGFIGSVLGFVIGILLGKLGIIILCIAAIAVYGTFFYADKTGSFGKRVIAFKNTVNTVSSDVKTKIQETNEKNKQHKEEEALDKRRLVSDELADDDFFKPRGTSSDVKIAELGIDETKSVTGAATLLPKNEPAVEEIPEPAPLS